MKKMTLLISMFLFGVSASLQAQFSCAGAVAMTNGYTANGITTPGLGSGSPGAWVTSSIDCQGTGGQSSTLGATSTCWNQVFDTVGDDYVFSYTTGANAGETVFFQIFTRQDYVGIMAFTDCNGTAISGCLSGAYSAGVGDTGATLSVTATDLPANQTVYFGVGVWTLPNDLDFDVTAFTVTPALGVDDVNQNKIGVYPNPVSDVLHIANLLGLSDVSIYNTLGQEVIVLKGIDAAQQINVSGLASGTYLVKVDSDGKTSTFKIIKN